MTGLASAAAACGVHADKKNGNVKKDHRPNIVIVFSDEMTLKHLSCYGGEYHTPHIDALAAGGMRFTRAYSAGSMCTPARYGMLTGQYPGRCATESFRNRYPDNESCMISWNSRIDKNTPNFGRVLSKAGYTTAFVGKDHNMLHDSMPAKPDLDPSADITSPAVQKALQKHQKEFVEAIKRVYGFDYAASVTDNFDQQHFAALKYHNIPWITKGAVDFLEQQQAKSNPFLLYVAPTGIHGPHHGQSIHRDIRYTPEGFDPAVADYAPDYKALTNQIDPLSSGKQHHLAGIAEIDHLVGVLQDKIKDMGEEENTLFMFLPDHNVEPGKTSCYEHGFHIPLVMRWPRKIKAGSISHSLVQTVDMFPTFAKLAGTAMPEGKVFDGASMEPIFDSPQKSIREQVYLESGMIRAISNGRYKYVAFRPQQKYINKMENNKVAFAYSGLGLQIRGHSQVSAACYPGYFDQNQLYDLQNDPYEQNNIYNEKSHGTIKKRLKQRLEQKLKTFRNTFSLEDIPYMETKAYRDKAAKTRAKGILDTHGYYKRDHDKIVWPPPDVN